MSFVLFGKKSKSNSFRDDSSDITIKEELKIDTNDALTNEISSNDNPIVLGINSRIKTESIKTNLNSHEYRSEQNPKTIDLKTIHSDVIVPKIKEELNENSSSEKSNPRGECQNHLQVIGQNLVVVNPGLKETLLKTENKEKCIDECRVGTSFKDDATFFAQVYGIRTSNAFLISKFRDFFVSIFFYSF